MNTRALFLAFSLLLVGTGPRYAYAADWRPVINSGLKSKFDASRISYMSPSVIRVWEKYTLPDKVLDKTRKNDKADLIVDYAYTIVLIQVDCRRLSVGVVSLNHYNSRGFVAIHEPVPPDSEGEDYDDTFYKDSEIKMEPVLPNSEGEDLVKTVCNFVGQ